MPSPGPSFDPKVVAPGDYALFNEPMGPEGPMQPPAPSLPGEGFPYQSFADEIVQSRGTVLPFPEGGVDPGQVQMSPMPGAFPPDGGVDHSPEAQFNRAWETDTAQQEDALRHDQKEGILQALFAGAANNPGDILGMLGDASQGMAGPMSQLPLQEMRRSRKEERLGVLAKIKALNAPSPGTYGEAAHETAYWNSLSKEEGQAKMKEKHTKRLFTNVRGLGQTQYRVNEDGSREFNVDGLWMDHSSAMDAGEQRLLEYKGKEESAKKGVAQADRQAGIDHVRSILPGTSDDVIARMVDMDFLAKGIEASPEDVRRIYKETARSGIRDVMTHGTPAEKQHYARAQAENDEDAMMLIVLEIKKRRR